MSADGASASPWESVTPVPSFVDSLDEGGVFVSDLLAEFDLPVAVEGVVYHDRGVRVPAHDAVFYREPRGSRGIPTFAVDVAAVGPRSAWAVFDASADWDGYLLQSADVAALAWMSDGEFESEEADHFASKSAAVKAGRFSFGVFLPERVDWESQARSLNATNSPAFLQHEDGSTTYPRTESEFYEYVGSSREEFRLTAGGAPTYLGVVELGVSVGD